MNLVGKKFYDERFEFNDGDAAFRCTFHGCVMYAPVGIQNVRIEQCEFKFCRFEGGGWPKDLLEFIT